MSVEAMAWALKQTTQSAVDKLVLVALGNFSDDQHQCFPSRKTLAAMAMCSVDTVDRALIRLQDAGLIEKETRTSNRGGLTSNCYTLSVVADAQRPTRETTPSRKMRPAPLAAERPHPQPQDAATLAAQLCPHPSRTGAATYEPLLEPSPEKVVVVSAKADWQVVEAKLVEAAGAAIASQAIAPGLANVSPAFRWIEGGCDLDLDILPTIRAIAAQKRRKPIVSWEYFTQAVVDAKAARSAPLPEARADQPQMPSKRQPDGKPTLAAVFAQLKQQSAGAAQ